MLKKSQRLPLFIGLLAVGLTAMTVVLIYSSEPEAQKDGATKESAMLVEVKAVQKSQYTPTIRAMGEVVPAQQVDLRPRVTGTVDAVSQRFVPGNIVDKGEWLVKLESDDYELALQRARAALARAQSLVDIEMGEQDVARNDLKTLGREVPEKNRALILREPQLKQVEADVQSAEVAVKEAELALQRTVIRMPFKGQIMSQDANLGSHLSPADIIGNVVGTARYWVEAALPSSQLKWLDASHSTPDNHKPATLINETAWDEGVKRTGIVKEIIATLDTQTRMATVLIEVDDPLLKNQPTDKSTATMTFSPLIAGSYVEVQLPGMTLTDVFRIPVSYLRKDNTVWVAQEQTLKIRDVVVAYRDEQYAYIRRGLNNGDQIITTNLAAVRNGAAIQLKQKVTSSQNQSVSAVKQNGARGHE